MIYDAFRMVGCDEAAPAGNGSDTDGVENEDWYIMKPNMKIFDGMKTLKLCRLLHNFL